MGSVVEKITLYDILGYVMPGSLIVLTIGGRFIVSGGKEVISLYESFSGFITYGFILLSFICGILVSELGRIVIQGKAEKNFSVPDAVVRKALANAKVIKSENETVKIEDYIRYMYSDIQSDSNYKRIHNYASAEVMCKNLTVAVLFSAIAASTYDGLLFCERGLIILFGMALAFLLWHRYRRFDQKKQNYAVSWYVEKYISGSN